MVSNYLGFYTLIYLRCFELRLPHWFDSSVTMICSRFTECAERVDRRERIVLSVRPARGVRSYRRLSTCGISVTVESALRRAVSHSSADSCNPLPTTRRHTHTHTNLAYQNLLSFFCPHSQLFSARIVCPFDLCRFLM